MRVLVTGATGCIGRRLVPFLRAQGHDVVRGVRRPQAADDRRFDLDDDATLRPALAGCDAAVYLVHGLARGAGYGAWETRVAGAFARACVDVGVGRIVYLGGVLPSGTPSPHLRARAATGVALRLPGVDVVELRAGMIVAADSASFVLARDIAARLPVALRPPWLKARQRPVAIDDVVAAIELALTIRPGIYACPGPEALGGDEVLAVLARLQGRQLQFRDVSWADHALAARALAWLSDAPADVVAELVLGMTGDLVGDDPDIFALRPTHQRWRFIEAARRALAEQARVARPTLPSRLWEGAMRRLAGPAR
jgi:uncharacterized protein YbjT (DUF2867 family)